MRFIEYSHRHAREIIAGNPELQSRYTEFTEAIASITDDELINDFIEQRSRHSRRDTAFKSLTPSINAILKNRLLTIPGWVSEVDIFNDNNGLTGNTEWRLDFACDEAFCVEIAFNHGEAIAWNLLKPVLACELNHVEKAIQGQIGIYVCATDKMKIAANIDSASGSFEKVLRYLPPMMNQLTIPLMIIGLEPLDTFKISKTAEILRPNISFTDMLVNHKVMVIENDYSTYTGHVKCIEEVTDGNDHEMQIVIEKYRRPDKRFLERMVKFIEILE